MSESMEIASGKTRFWTGRHFLVTGATGTVGSCCEHIQPTIMNSAKGEIHNQYLSSAKAANLLHWKPAYELGRSLVETLAWYLAFFGEAEQMSKARAT